MRVVYLGGTRFIGRAAVRALAETGHDVMVIHRGGDVPCEETEHVFHRHADRRALGSISGDIDAFVPDVVVDGFAYSRQDAEEALAIWPRQTRLVVLSSADVYRAYEVRDTGRVSEPMPLDEESPVREGRYPYRGKIAGMDAYEKLDVEAAYLEREAAVLRLGSVYGPGDPQRREEFILRRVRSDRQRIPIGAGTWPLSRLYVEDCAQAVRLAVEAEDIGGEVFNVAESKSPTVRLWAQQILAAAGSRARLVRVADEALPEDMAMTAAIPQPMLIDNSKLQRRLGWIDTPAEQAVLASVAWHLEHPPSDVGASFEADDEALAGV